MSTLERLAPTLTERLRNARPPVVTLVLEAPAADEHRVDQRELALKEARAAVEDQAPAELVDRALTAAEAALESAEPRTWVGVVADAADVTTVPLVDSRAPVAEVGALPRFVPFVKDAFEHRPHVVALCDRTAAAIAEVGRRGILRETDVVGDDHQVQKVHSGGWSHARMQRHSEHTWDQNAREISDAIVRAAEHVDASVVAVSGDVRAIGLVEEHLPTEWREKAAFTEFEAGDHQDEMKAFALAETLVRDQAAREVVTVLERFAEHRGRGEAAADGTDAVLTALQTGAVDTLLVSEEDESSAFLATDDPRQIALDRDTLTGLGLDDVIEVRLADAAIAAALAEGADVVVVPTHGPDAPNGPLGAILRY